MSQGKEPEDLPLSRRGFLRGLGIAIGGVAAGGGASQIAFGQAAIPSGYTFYRLLTVGDAIMNAGNVAAMTPAIMIGNYNSIGSDVSLNTLFFHGTSKVDANHRPIAQPLPAVFRVLVQYQDRKPPLPLGVDVFLISGSRLTEIQGVPQNQLPLFVSKIGTGSGNAQGNFACTIVPQDFGQGPDGSISLNSVPGAYLYNTAAKSWSKVARFGDNAPGGGQYGGIFGDLVLHDDNSVTLVAATTAAPAPTTLGSSRSPARVPLFGGSHALIHVGESGQQELLLKTGDMLPRTNAMIESFGLIDVVRGEHFVAQVTARRSDRLNAPQGTAVVQGRLGGTRRNRVDGLIMHAASPHLVPDAMLKDDTVLLGESILGPRIGAGGRAAIVTHNPAFADGFGESERERMTLVGRDHRHDLIARAGEARGPRVPAALGAPVISSEVPLTYAVQLLDDGVTELFISNGTEKVTILRSLDVVQGATITEINHGYHPAQVDVFGRLAFAAEFLKPNGRPDEIQTSLVIGIPN
jgi:hypothetical protein